jgi:hypothetical protein
MTADEIHESEHQFIGKIVAMVRPIGRQVSFLNSTLHAPSKAGT